MRIKKNWIISAVLILICRYLLFLWSAHVQPFNMVTEKHKFHWLYRVFIKGSFKKVDQKLVSGLSDLFK